MGFAEVVVVISTFAFATCAGALEVWFALTEGVEFVAGEPVLDALASADTPVLVLTVEAASPDEL